MNLATFARTALAVLSIGGLAPAAGVLQDGEPGPYSSRLDGPGQDRMLDMTTDAFGNVYVIGSFTSDDMAEMAVETYRDEAGSGTGAVAIRERKIVRSAGGEDIFVAKYDASGKLLWLQSAGGTGDDYGTGVAVDDKGNVFITGSYSGTALIGGTTLDTSLRTANDGEGKVVGVNMKMQSDLFVAMLDSSGAFRWAKRLDHKLVNRPSGARFQEVIRIDNGPPDHGPQPGYILDNGAAYLSGDPRFGWTRFDNPNIGREHHDDHYRSTDEIAATESDRSFIHLRGEDDAFRLNVAAAGRYRLTVRSGDIEGGENEYNLQLITSEKDEGSIMNRKPDPKSEIVQGIKEFELSAPGYIWIKQGPNSNNDALNSLVLEKLTDEGADIVITGFYGLRSGDNAHPGKALTIDKDGNLYIKGRFLDLQNLLKSGASPVAMNLQFVTANGTSFLLDDDRTVSGSRMAFVTRLKIVNPVADKNDIANFQWDWLTQFGTGIIPDLTTIADLATDSAGDIYVTGAWRGQLLAGGPAVTAGPFNEEGFFMRLRRGDGTRTLLSRMIPPGEDTDQFISPEAIAVDAAGDAYILGNFNHRLFDQVLKTWTFKSVTGADIVSTPTATRDFFVAKTSSSGTWMWVTKPEGAGLRTGRDITLDPAGNILVTGGIDSGPVAFGGTSLSPTLENSTEPFVARLTLPAGGAQPVWTKAVKTDTVADPALTANQARYHGVSIVVTPGGALYWLVSSGRDSSLERNLNGSGFEGGTDLGASYTLGTRTGQNRTYDSTRYYGGFLLSLDLDLVPTSTNTTGYYTGQLIPAPALALRDEMGRPMRPEIEIDGNANTDSSAYFYWDTVEGKLYAVSPKDNAVVKWRVSAENTISVPVPTRWPTEADPEGAFQLHIIGAGTNGAAPAVDLNIGERTHSFVRILFTDASATEAGGKLQAAREGFTAVLYVVGDASAAGTSPALIQAVRHLRWQSRVGAAIAANIGSEIKSTEHKDTARNGYVVNAAARYDGDPLAPAYNRETRLGPIIPVNTDDPDTDTDDMVVLWYKPSPKTGIYWPVVANRYDCQWPANPEKIVITSSQGSDVAIPTANGPVFPQEALRPDKFQNPRIYHQPDKTKPGYNPNEEHALLAESQTRDGASVYALRNDLNHRAPNGINRTSDPYVLLKYQDGEAGGRSAIKVYRVELIGTYNKDGESVTFDFNSYKGFAGTRIRPPFPLSTLGDRPETQGGGDPYWQDRTGAVWARSAGALNVGYWYPKRPDFWYDRNGDGIDDNVPAIPWLEFTPLAEAPNNVTPPEGDPVNIIYDIAWPENLPVLRVGDTLTRAKNGLPDLAQWQSAEIVFDQNDPRVGHTDPALAAQGDPFKMSARLLDAISQREVAFAARDMGGQLNTNTQGKPLLVELGPAGKRRLTDLPPHLKSRVLFNPNAFGGEGGLSFEGFSPIDPTGATTPLINVMSPGERDELLRADDIEGEPVITDWDRAVLALYELTRNPNGISVPGSDGLLYGFDSVEDGKPHLATILGNAALTAGLGKGVGYITLAENNHSSLEGNPVALHILRVENPPVTGSINVINSDNVFDERVTLRHNADFGGDPSQLTFEWYYLPDPGGQAPEFLPPGGGWSMVASGPGLNSIIIGGAGLRTLGDGLYYVRYRGYGAGGFPVDAFTQFGGDRSGTDAQPIPVAVAGWIKRVIQGINPFEQRVNDFHSSPTQTYASLIQQAGTRFEGAIALNPNADNVNNIGLISLYETLLRRGLSLSINGTPPATTPAVNQALLLAASRTSDFYMLLGNEAFGDAQDPTIGYNVAEGPDFGTLSSSVFAFQNQLPSLIDEELSLLRGRDATGAGVAAAPVYNHLFWNFTKGLEGEPAYVTNYNVTDQNFDGNVDTTDAAFLYPQGHGDAWGQYLSATKVYYRLLRHPLYTWMPRSERLTIAGVGINVDYLDEVKFARAAAAKAKAGREIVDLTYRNRYVGDPRGQFQGYKDTDAKRAWGVDEWGRRAGQAAFFDWVTANAILPAASSKEGLEKIDRTTVTELQEIATQFASIEAAIENVDRGLNPLGLSGDVIPFDIDPTFTFVGSTAAIGGVAVQGLSHFEQVYLRAQDAVKNALGVYNLANESTQRLRQIQLSANTFANQVEEEERDYKNRLIEIFGYPYEGDIGGGKIYPSGYDGPDLYKWMYVDVAEFSSNVLPSPASSTTAYYSPLSFEPQAVGSSGMLEPIKGHFFQEDVPEGTSLLGSGPQGTFQVEYPLIPLAQRGASQWAFASMPQMGVRRAPGTLQQAIAAMVAQEAEAFRAVNAYSKYIDRVQDTVDLLQARFNVAAEKLRLLDKNTNTATALNERVASLRSAKEVLNVTAETVYDTADVIVEAFPTVFGIAANDVTAPARAAAKAIGVIGRGILNFAAAGTESRALFDEATKDNLQLKTDLEIERIDLSLEALEKVKELEQLLREETEYRVQIFQKQRDLENTVGEFRRKLAEGERLLQERIIRRQKVAGPVQTLRYQDLTFRTFRNDVLQKYRAAFDLAARYVYIAARAYDYETCLLGTQGASGQNFLASIVRQRSLGQFVSDRPINGVNGLSDPMARMLQNFTILKGQLGFNSPQLETGRISMRKENFRIKKLELAEGEEASGGQLDEEKASAEKWRQTLQSYRVPDLWQVPEFRRYCRAFAPESAGAQPGLVIEFNTEVTFGLNFFGKPLAGGDSSYDSSHFATKIREVGVWFENYNGKGLAETPRVYLVPVGIDIVRSPSSNALETREFTVVDQRLPLPLPIGNNDLTNPSWIPSIDSMNGDPIELRRFARFRAYHDGGGAGSDAANRLDSADLSTDTRLIGRSVWNTRWLLIIPGGTFLQDADEGLDTFINGQPVPGSGQRDGNGVKDIKLIFTTYAYPGL